MDETEYLLSSPNNRKRLLDAMVELSSGCIFCDVGLKPTKMKRQYIHNIKGRNIICPLQGIKPTDL